MDGEYIDLYDLQRQMRESVEDSFPVRLWVRAEVASLQVKANGHCYMDLSQSEDGKVIARVRAVIWCGNYMPLAVYFREATGSELGAGVELLVRAQMTFSEVYGLTLVIDEIEPRFTLGAAELKKRRTIERLTADGVMDMQKKLVPSVLPYNLAVISAADAAGYGDFRKHLADNAYGFAFEVQLFPAAMQGKGAPVSIADALACIECAQQRFDAVLIMRGGGSVLDLSCFDDYGLCLAIAGCSIPVYTAIGHEKDVHVADMVAHGSAKTPTALADLFIDALAAEDERISALGNRLRLALLSKVGEISSALDVLEARIRNADPRSVLLRGYALVTDARGVVMKSSRKAMSGDEIWIMFEDGTLKAKVN